MQKSPAKRPGKPTARKRQPMVAAKAPLAKKNTANKVLTPKRASQPKPAKSAISRPIAYKTSGASITELVAAILPVDVSLLGAAKQRLDSLTKPQGSLGQLELLAAQIALITGNLRPRIVSPVMIVFAGDHGAANAGLSAYPSEVTLQMLHNYLRGGAAINVLARELALQLVVVNAGVMPAAGAPLEGLAVTGAAARRSAPRFVDHSLAAGTRNYLLEPAMTREQAERALKIGAQLATELATAGADCVALGEMGIGNTASSALLMHCLTGLPLADCVGRGTGLDDAGLARKRQLLAQAIARGGRPKDPIAALCEYGGFEIAMLTGAILGASSQRLPVVIDGFTVSIAAALSGRIAAASLDYCIYAHRSAESGHRQLLDYLGAEPLLDLGMRLGEGSGAALGVALCRSAAALMRDMASFESAGVSRPAA
jgi:nicotinate-nucleotide--dimethylbenzimidazole phosphoribosyltransferase